MHAGKDLDERGFPGPVVSEQAMDLSGLDREVDVLERDYRTERLGHVSEFDDGLHGYSRP